MRVWLGLLTLTFNNVNIYGNTCPAFTLKNQTCPVVCVASLWDCPLPIRPTPCSVGKYYCADGTCHEGQTVSEACTNVKSICECQGNPNFLIPCKIDLSDVSVMGQGTIESVLENGLNAACSAAIGINISNYPLACSAQEKQDLVWDEPEFVVFYIALLGEAVVLFAYYLYRKVLEMTPQSKLPLGDDESIWTSMFPGPVGNSKKVQFDEVISNTATETKPLPLQFSGFKPHLFGMLVESTVKTTSAVWFVILAVLIADYYQVFAFAGYNDRDMLFVNHDNLSRVFIIVWHVTTYWLVFLQINSVWLQTYFYRSCSLHSANYVLVQKQVQAAVKTKGLGPIVESILEWETYFRRITKTDKSLTLIKVKETDSGKKYVEFECVRYVFDEQSGVYEPWSFQTGPSNADLHAQARRGLTSEEAARRRDLNGPNQVLFQVDTFVEGMTKEFSGAFYIYQGMMLIIWCYYAYYYMGLILAAVIVGSGIVKVLVSTEAQKRVLEMATFHGHRKALRNGSWVTIDSSELVPGDVIQIETTTHALSVDCILIEGDVVIDESSLTGEALPVAKFCIKNDPVHFNRKEGGKVSTLYAGCHILETRPMESNIPVKAIVFATGASTTKGKLVRDILYPLPIIFVFMEHLKIVVPMLLFWGGIMLGLSVLLLDASSVDSWFYGMFTISQILSPLLPAVLVIGQSISAERLKADKIMCVDLTRIALAGKVKVFCFDKTGTLTKEGLDFLGTQSIDSGKFNSLQTEFTEFPATIQTAMKVCHSLSIVNEKHVGNFVDVEMFKSTKSSLEFSNGVTHIVNGSQKIRIVKRFEFVHSNAYMSVIVQDVQTGKLTVYLKGSYEKIQELSSTDSLPSNYEAIAKQHAGQGCYVLAIASKSLPETLTASEVCGWTREAVEKEASAVGLIMFRNELKSEAEFVLDELRGGGCRCVMITGDHPHTAIHVARMASMFPLPWQGQGTLVLYAEVDKTSKKVIWANADTFEEFSQNQVEDLVALARLGGRKVELAVSGHAFNALLSSNWMSKYLNDTRIFARMSPKDKVRCVRLHMETEITAMCGDGGNDAGALKAAHAGISLSEAESSVVAHFSSCNRSLRACLTLLKESRCSLDVSFAAYKFLLMYGEILSFAGLIQYYFMVSMSQTMWILIDGCTVPVSWALTLARPSPKLIKSRPTARLLGPQTVLSVTGQIVIDLVFLIILVCRLYEQEFFLCHEFDGSNADLRRWWELADNYEGATTGIMAMFQILFAAFAFNIGSRYRLGFFRNYTFIAVFGFVFSFLTFITLADPNSLGCLFHVNCGTAEALTELGYASTTFAPSVYYSVFGHNVIPFYFRFELWFLCVLNCCVVTAWEFFVILGPARHWIRPFIVSLGLGEAKPKALFLL